MTHAPMTRILRSIVAVEDDERGALLWSFACFFFLLGGYYVLRPVREAMALAGGVSDLPWLFTGTFVAMLVAVPAFGAVVARMPRQRFVPLVYRFFLVNILIFAALMGSDATRVAAARAFYIWMSVYNLFVVSVFWGVMADLFTSAQGKRLFGFIAAGGTAGTLIGSWLTSAAAEDVGVTGLLIVAALVLECSVQCFRRAGRLGERVAGRTGGRQGAGHAGRQADGAMSRAPRADGRAIGGSALAGLVAVFRSPYLLGICGYILCIATAATFLYFLQAQIVSKALSGDDSRTALFATINLLVGLGTVLLQVLVTPRMLTWLGIGGTLAVTPLCAGAGFLGLALLPALATVIAAQAVVRAARYAIARPARELLFTVVSREDKYKAKSFIDTVVYRGGDAVSAWAFSGLQALGLAATGIAVIGLPLAALWLANGLLLGRKQDALSSDRARAGNQTHDR